MGYDNRTALPENHNLIINDLNTGNTYSVTIEKEIGRGGSCVVYKGTQKDWVGNERITRSVIIKEFYPKALDSLVSRSSESMDLNISEEAQELYEDRLALFCSGQAKHIIYANENAGRSLPPVSFSGYAHNTFYAVSNQGQGVTLSELNRDNISLTEALSISVSVCDAINAIHSNGMKLYLDLKPDNIYVFDNRGFLFDFDTVQPKERLRFSSYSDGWSAPEQVFNDDSGYINTKKIGFHTDIYSIGAVLFYLLVGRKPSSEELKRINEKAFDWQNEITLLKSENALKDEVFVSELSRVMQEILESDADTRKLSFGNLDAALKLKHELEHLISLVDNAPYRKGFEDTNSNIENVKSIITNKQDEIIALLQDILKTPSQKNTESDIDFTAKVVDIIDTEDVQSIILNEYKINADFETPIFIHELLESTKQYFDSCITFKAIRPTEVIERMDYLLGLTTDQLFDELRSTYPNYDKTETYVSLKEKDRQDKKAARDFLIDLIFDLDDSNGEISNKIMKSWETWFENLLSYIRMNRAKIVCQIRNDITDSSWDDRKRNGFGIRHLISGDVYEGEWKNDKYEGHGKCTYIDGSVYEGNWNNGERNGEGTLKSSIPDANGAIEYIGNWKNDLKNGIGIEKYSSGKEYEGEWINGVPNGIGTYRYDDGEVYHGEVKNGKRNGYGEYIATNRIHRGQWKDSQPNGIGYTEFSKGKMFYYGNLTNAKPDGFGIEASINNGYIYIGNWHEGKKDSDGVIIKLEGGTATIIDCIDGEIITEDAKLTEEK